jgi:hypothetical protein
MKEGSFRYPALTAGLFMSAAFAVLYSGALGWPGVDFWRPWVASRADVGDVYSRAGRELLYRAVVPPPGTEDRASREQIAASLTAPGDASVLGYRGLHVVHSPVLLAVFSAFRSDDFERDYRIYLAASLACFVGAAVLMGMLVGFSLPVSLLTAAALALVLECVSSDLRVGNVNSFQLASVAAFLALERRQVSWADVAGGGVLTLAVAFKPNVALIAVAVALAWVGDRRWRKLAGTAAGAAAATVVALAFPPLLVPAAPWAGWVGMLPEVLDGVLPIQAGNFGLAALIAEGTGHDVSRVLLGIALLLLAIASLRPLWSAAGPSRNRTLAAVAAGAALLLVSGRLVWIHYVVLATPAILLALRMLAGSPSRWAWAAGASLLPLTVGVSSLLKIIDGTSVLAAVTMNLSALGLVAVGLWELWRGETVPV